MDARQRLVGELGRERRTAAHEGRFQDRFHAQAQVGVEAVARHINQAGDEALVGVAPGEQAGAPVLLQMQDREAHLEQLVARNLEQLVAREALENVEQRFAVVTARREAGALDGAADPAAQQRNVHGRAVVGGRGEQADKAALALDPARLVEGLDADDVHMDQAMDARGRVRLVDHQDAGRVHEAAYFGRQGAVGGPAGDRVHPVEAQQAEAAVLDHPVADLAGLLGQRVFAKAQKREVIVEQPVEKGDHLLDLVFRQVRRVLGEPLGGLAQLRRHRLPGVDYRADVVEHMLQRARQFVEISARRVLVDLDMDQGFAPRALGRAVGRRDPGQALVAVACHAEHRVDDQMNHQVVAVELGAHGIDQERHVVVDHLDDGVVRLPAVSFQGGVVDPDLGPPAPAGLREVPVRERGAVEVARAAVGQILRRHRFVITAHEALGLVSAIRRQAVVQQADDPLDELDLLLPCPAQHGPSCTRVPSAGGASLP